MPSGRLAVRTERLKENYPPSLHPASQSRHSFFLLFSLLFPLLLLIFNDFLFFISPPLLLHFLLLFVVPHFATERLAFLIRSYRQVRR